jgi:putative restriction endonuclease
MAKAIFTTKVDPTYDDLPEFRYHFPRTYLRAVEATVGDWIIYYEPRRATGELSSGGGRQSYFATARVAAVRPDPTLPDHFYAFVEGFLQFARPVQFRDYDFYYESALRRSDGGTSKGAFGRAVRPISDSEYGSILTAASSELLMPDSPDNVMVQKGFADEPAIFERPIVERMTSRPFRDATFSSAVRHDWAEDHQRRRPPRSAGRTHPARRKLRPGFRPQWPRTMWHYPLDVRSRFVVAGR